MEDELSQLWEKYVNRTASEDELKLLFEYLQHTDTDPRHIAWLETYLESGAEEASFDENYWSRKIQKILHREEKHSGTRGPYLKKRQKYLMAAVVIVLAGIGLVFLKMQPWGLPAKISKSQSVDSASLRINHATITLTDGSIVMLDSVTNGQLALQENSRLIKLPDGRIVYESLENTVTHRMQTNTLTNPRGGRVVDMILSDGTRVWLNAGSSISYPVVFSGNERKVVMSGEAYFEVAHDASRPFYVEKSGLVITVLGTNFNVNAYEDEPVPSVTLLQGKVSVATKEPGKPINALQIKTGQQVLFVNGHFKLNASPDLKAIMAWKNGDFEFDGLTIQSIMRQVSRWYDMDIVYQGEIPADEFIGKISRQETVSKLLKILEATGKVTFHIQGRTIFVHKL